MFSDIVLTHRPGGQGSTDIASGSQQWFHWQTCLRQVAIGDETMLRTLEPSLSSSDEVLHGEEAYRFLLQIVCGLHSPLIGETEVSGQFKNAVAAYHFPVTPWGSHLKRFFRAIFEDAKVIRQKHLKDLGSQSYGSVLRREIRGFNRIHVLGGGHLVREILPWINKDHSDVHIHARDAEKVQKQLAGLLRAQGGATVSKLTERVELARAQVLIIAAPVSAAWIEEWLGAWLTRAPDLALLIDLRADSQSDQPRLAAANSFLKRIALGDVFQRIEKNQSLLNERKKTALAAIDEAVDERGLHVEYRPFGWEDVCA